MGKSHSALQGEFIVFISLFNWSTFSLFHCMRFLPRLAHLHSSPPSLSPPARISLKLRNSSQTRTQGKLPSIYPQPSKTLTASLQCRDKKMDTWTVSDVISRALTLGQTSCLLDWQMWKKLHVLCGLCSQLNQILVLACFECNFQYIFSAKAALSQRGFVELCFSQAPKC